MRKVVATTIVAFANLITFPLGPTRRRDAKVIAQDLLAPTVPVETKRGRLLFDIQSRRCFTRAKRFHTSEPETLAWIDAMPDDACLWDIGANVGVFSVYAALHKERRVVAFEPAGSTYAVLNRNIELNDMSDQVTAYCIAFSNRTKLDVLNMASTEAGRAMHGFGTELNQLGEIINTKFRQGAIGYSIDDFVRKFSPPFPTHVKIDVDGIEPDILLGGRETLSAPTVRSMIIEIEGNPDSQRNREIMDLMTGLGFTARSRAPLNSRNVIYERSSD